MQTSGDQRREIAASYSVVTRLVRNCALGRVIQYSRDGVIEPRSRGVLDRPVKPDDDSGELLESRIESEIHPHAPTLLRRQRHTNIAITTTISPTAIAP